jgi:hypothetical protein
MRKSKPLPPLEDLKRLFDYDPETGELAYKERPANCIKLGEKVKRKNKGGYVTVKIKGKTYLAHRIIYYLMTGTDPVGSLVDHKNRDRSDNRWNNLRLATILDNNRNCSHPGYCLRPNGTWRVRVRHLGKVLFDKTVKTEEEARALITEKRTEFYGEFAPV